MSRKHAKKKTKKASKAFNRKSRARARAAKAVSAPKPLSGEELGAQLVLAAQLGRVDTIERLLKAKADINFQDHEKNLDYDYRSSSDYRGAHWQNVQPSASRRGACGNTALMWACHRHHEKAALALLAAGADPRITNVIGETALHLIGPGSEEIVDALVAAGADVNARNAWGSTPLMMALEADSDGRLAAAWSLIGYGADPDIRTTASKDSFAVAAELELEPIFIRQMKQRAEGIKNVLSPKKGGPTGPETALAKKAEQQPELDIAEVTLGKLRTVRKAVKPAPRGPKLA